MSKITTIVKRYDGNTLTSQKNIIPISAIIRREGTRSVDNAEFKYTAQNDIKTGDDIYYLQDIVDVNNLTAIWNFFGSYRDESGNDFDDLDNSSSSYAIPSGRFGYSSTGKFSGYQHTILGTNFTVIIPNKLDNNNNSILDFSTDFDMYFSMNINFLNTGSNFILDKFTSNSGIKIDMIKINSTNYTVVVTVGDGTTTLTITTPNIYSSVNGSPFLLRVSRVSNTVNIHINNVLSISDTFSGDITNVRDLFLFSQYSTSTTGTNYFMGFAYQVRIYCQRCLSDEDHKIIYDSKPQSMTMKFGGTVWKLDDRGMEKIVNANSFSNIVLNTQIQSSLYDASTTTFSNTTTRIGTTFYSNGATYPKFSDILKETLKRISIPLDSYEFLYSEVGSVSSNKLYGNYIADGSFLDILNQLIVFSNGGTFTFTPRKLLIINDIKQIGFVLSNNNSRILESGYDDTNTVNSLYIVGDIENEEYSKSFSNVAFTVSSPYTSTTSIILNTDDGWEMDLGDIRVWQGTLSGTAFTMTKELQLKTAASNVTEAETYSINNITRSITINSATSTAKTYLIHYIYKRKLVKGVAQSGLKAYYDEDTTSITDNGLYAKKYYAPQFNGYNTFLNFADKFLELYSDIGFRVRVETSQILNSVIEGQKISIYYITKNIGTIDNDGVVTPLAINVKSIEFRYPESKTILELGDFLYNSFDLERMSTESLRQIGVISQNK